MNWPSLDRHRLREDHNVPSPALLVYPDLIQANLRRMIDQVGDVKRLRPHVKTDKMAEVVATMRSLGITKVKCATIAEAEMCADAGMPDILLAYQPVGPQIDRFIRLIQTYPDYRMSTIVDCAEIVAELQRAAERANVVVPVFVDIDCGMKRSGIAAGKEALAMYQSLVAASSLQPAGLHVYDGHIRDSDLAAREIHCARDLKPAMAFKESLLASGWEVPSLVLGGTPTFPIHARNEAAECSPGTCVLWDAGYARLLPDMNYEFAALVLTRVVSKPGTRRLCLDLGHKAIASEGPHPRVIFPDLENATAVSHSEEHLVLETDRAGEFRVGDCLYGIPWHICPTVALYDEAVVVRDGHATETWKVAARARRLSV